MTDATIRTTVTGGHIQGIASAGTVVIENFTIYNRSVEEPAADAAGEPIPPCPYPGLAYFGPEDAELFFGRDAAISRLADEVGRQSLTALVGASGSGKSSVVLAGLAPRLHGMDGWRFSHFRVGTELETNPFLALARALVPLYVASGSETERLLNIKQLAEKLQTGELNLRDVFADCRSRNKGTRILLIADQFEEVFTLVGDEAVLHRFIDVLLAGFPEPASGSSPDICLILTLRADFYGRALRHRPLADALQGHVENLGPMNRVELEAAIRRPAGSAKVSFELGLVETLLDDVESRPGSLPLLQFALREMWRRQAKREITRQNYDDIGGVEGALAQRAERIFAAMTENGTNAQMAQAFQRLFTRLVTLGEGQEDTRRVVDRRELSDDVWSLAQRLAGEDNRLVVTNAPAFSRETAEVVHEALIRHWPRLVDWINRDRAFQTWLRQIKPNVERWSADSSDDGPLLRGGMLAQAVEWFARRRDDLSATEQGYIGASLALQRQAEDEREAARHAETRRQQEETKAAVKRARLAVAGGVIVLALATAAIFSRFEASTAKRRALTERDRAQMELLAIQAHRANAEAKSPDQIALAGALALESIQVARKNNFAPQADAIETVRSALFQLPSAVLSQGGRVAALAALVDGRLASAGTDGTIKLWPKDFKGAPIVISQGSELISFAALADGRLASAGTDGAIKLWPKDFKGAPIVLSQGSETLISLAALADGRLASAGAEGTIMLWPKDFKGAPIVLSQGSELISFAALADGRLANAGADGTIMLWPKDFKGAPIVLSQDESVCSLAGLADGRLASGGTDGAIKLWSKDGKGQPLVLSGRYVFHEGLNSDPAIESLAALADGRLASAGTDGTIKLWPTDGKGAPVVLLQGDSVYSLAVLADGRLASAGTDGTIKLWPKEIAGEPVLSLDDINGDEIVHLVALPDGRLASGYLDGRILLWPKDGKGEPVVISPKGEEPIESLAILQDGRLVSGQEFDIKIWPKVGTGAPVVLSQWEPLASLAVLADGRLASGGKDGTIELWPKDGVGQPVVLSQPNEEDEEADLLSPMADGGLVSGDNIGGRDRPMADGGLVSGDKIGGMVRLWSKDGKGAPVVLFQGSGVESLTVLADGRPASGGADGNIKLWPKNGKGAPVVLSHGSFVDSLAVLADGRLASGGADGNIKLWPKDGKGAPVVLSNGSDVESLVVLADGQLASGGKDGKIKLWTVDEMKLTAALCLRAGHNLTKGEWARYIGSDTPWQPSCRDLPSNWETPD